jgi:hypothetical protein
MPLTDTRIRNAKPGSKAVRLFDERGLYLEVSPAGGKWWRLKYRFAGKEKRVSLGVYPDVTLKEARDRRDSARKLLGDGVDPSENRKATKSASIDRAANSFEVVTREWFGRYATRWAESHSSRVLRLFERDIFPWIGGRPIAEVSAAELLTVMRRIESRGALETALEPGLIAVKFFATPWRLGAVSATRLPICEVRSRRHRETTSRRRQNPQSSQESSAQWMGTKAT